MNGRKPSMLAGLPRRLGVTGLLILIALGGWSCDDDECTHFHPDTAAPAAPRGLSSITGDSQITLQWLANTEPDLDGYNVWWSDAYDGEYHFLASVAPSGYYDEVYVDTGIGNGATAFYGVTAYDVHGNESDLSLEEVWDTPRPAGRAEILAVMNGPDDEAFDLSRHEIVAVTSAAADFHYEVWHDSGEAYLVTHEREPGSWVLVQDMGWTADFDEISFAPYDPDRAPEEMGWSPTGIVEAIVGHTYVFLTPGWRYAKIRLVSVQPGQVVFDWAFQTDAWNHQLSVK